MKLLCFMFFLLISFDSSAQIDMESACFKWGLLVAASWHKTEFCTKLHPTLTDRATETKKLVRNAYPKLYESLDKEQWSENMRFSSLFSVYEDKNEDPKFSLESCQMSVENLAYYVDDLSFAKALSCWR